MIPGCVSFEEGWSALKHGAKQVICIRLKPDVQVSEPLNTPKQVYEFYYGKSKVRVGKGIKDIYEKAQKSFTYWWKLYQLRKEVNENT